MKILLATGLYPPDIGGPATYSKILHDTLPEYGHHVVVVHFGEVRHLPKGLRHLIYFIKAFRAGKHADIIFAQDPLSVGVPASAAALLLRKPFVLKVVGDYAWEQGVQRHCTALSLEQFVKASPLALPFRARALRILERWVVCRAHRVIVPSNYLKKIVAQWGVPKVRISVIYNSVREVEVSARRNVLRGMVGARGKLVMSAGRLVPWKGFDALIAIVPELRETFPGLKLMIAGDGPDRERLEGWVKQLGLGEHVVFLGPMDRDVLLRYLKIADVFALNSSYEGFSHQLLEAMSIGTPVVATRAGGNPEIIEHERHGLLVRHGSKRELRESITRMLGEAALRSRLARAAKRRVHDFSEKRMVQHLAELLEDVVSSQGR